MIAYTLTRYGIVGLSFFLPLRLTCIALAGHMTNLRSTLCTERRLLVAIARSDPRILSGEILLQT